MLVTDPAGDAYTIAGGHGCVVISRELFAALDRRQRAVLIAPELSRAGAARALAGVALHRHPLSRSRPDSGVPLAAPGWALGVATSRVTARVQALIDPPPRDRSVRMLVTAGGAVLTLLLG